MNGKHRPERGAAGDADQARLRQRVAQVALQRRPGETERASHQRAEDGARQADLPEDQRARLARCLDAETGGANGQR